MPNIDDTERVLVFDPRKGDGPFFVAEDLDDMPGKVGEYVGAEQCDGCGNHSYRIERATPDSDSYYAVCAVDPDESYEFKHTDPCGTHYRIYWEVAAKTVF